jgi:hypothetical protein
MLGGGDRSEQNSEADQREPKEQARERGPQQLISRVLKFD